MASPRRGSETGAADYYIQSSNYSMFNENELLRLLLLLADTQVWLDDLGKQCLDYLHPPAKKLLTSKTYRLGIPAFAHIIERHYYKTMRHPGTGKFTIPLAELLDHLKQAALLDPVPMKSNTNSKRILKLDTVIGVNKNGDNSSRMTVITDAMGNIITAYPD
jgi:hypothetical protein